MRMIVVSQLDRAGVMRGLITTLNKNRATFTPVATTIVYARRAEFAREELGDISESHNFYNDYSVLLRDTLEQGYARLV